MDLTIKVQRHALVLQALLETPKLAAAGQRRAINRAASRLRTQGVRRIAARVNLKSAYVRERLELRQATPATNSAAVRARARETRMDRLPNRQITKRGKNGAPRHAGIQVRIKKGRSAEALASAFYVPLRSGKSDSGNGMGIAVRTSVLQKLGYRGDSGSAGGSGSRRYEVLHTSSIRDLLADEVRGGLGDEILNYYQVQTDSEMRRAIVRARR